MRPVLLVLCVVAVLTAGCGASATPDPPQAGILGSSGHPENKAAATRVRRPFDPVPALLRCLRQQGIHTARRIDEVVIIGPRAQGLRIRFEATGGVTETAQLEGRAEGAEVIGRALLYPGTAPDKILKRIEDCTGDAGLKE